MSRKDIKTSETITENIFRDFYSPKEFIEKSAIPKKFGFVSKNNLKQKGFPDFFKHKKGKGFDFYIIVEAKATNHKQAINDTKHYMSKNKIDGNIIGIAISGQDTQKLKVNYYFKDVYTDEIKQLLPKKLLSISEITRLYKSEKFGDSISDTDLHETLNKINKTLHKNGRVRDTDRSLFFGGIMIALTNINFRKTYNTIQAPQGSKQLESEYLNEAILNAINEQLNDKVNNNLSKKISWQDSFSFIKTIDFGLDEYKELINLIQNDIFIPFKSDEKQDILGKAYKIFLNRAGKVDNKNIILTPDHIKRLMIEMARLNVDDVVIDTCTGTGGFLMEAMEILINLASGNPKKIKTIKEKQLIGFEVDRILFALACSNMFLHGDGKSNLIFRSSLLNDSSQHLANADDSELLKKIKRLKPTKCIINPPYENNNPIKFTKQALEYLEPNGKLIIIMPRTTLKYNPEITKELLEIAKLDFIIKMPENLFKEQDRTVNTAIFGFTKTRHDIKDRTIFYNLKDDGLISIQHKGRVDKFGKWQPIKEEILETIFNPTKEQQRRILDDDRNLNLVGVNELEEGYIALGELFDFERGKLASENNINGEYTFITAGDEHKTHNSYTHNCEALIYAVSASGSLGKCQYFNGKFIASNLCLVLTPKNGAKIELKFYVKYLNLLRNQIVEDLADGTSKLTIDVNELKEYKIKKIPLQTQKELVANLIKQEKLIAKKEKELARLRDESNKYVLKNI